MSPEDRSLVDRFLDMLAAEAGASRHTLAAYRGDLERAAELVTHEATDLGVVVHDEHERAGASRIGRDGAGAGPGVLEWTVGKVDEESGRIRNRRPYG